MRAFHYLTNLVEGEYELFQEFCYSGGYSWLLGRVVVDIDDNRDDTNDDNDDDRDRDDRDDRIVEMKYTIRPDISSDPPG